MPNVPTVWTVRTQALDFDVADQTGGVLLVGFHKASGLIFCHQFFHARIILGHIRGGDE